MEMRNKTGCHIILVGLLKEIPELRMDDHGNLITRIMLVTETPTTLPKHYQVQVLGNAALRIKQCGFLNARLWVEGDLHIQKNNPLICAKKIAFISDTEPNPHRVSHYFPMQSHHTERVMLH